MTSSDYVLKEISSRLNARAEEKYPMTNLFTIIEKISARSREGIEKKISVFKTVCMRRCLVEWPSTRITAYSCVFR